MDPTRISLARILEANVPLTWQDAVAVVQEVAMVSDVNAAMNSSPSLVSPEACFLTTAGEVDLPEYTRDQQPDAVASLLGDMLRGRDAPPALQSLARRHGADDLFGELAAFSKSSRRPVIAALASAAIEALTARPSAAPPAPEVAPPAPDMAPAPRDNVIRPSLASVWPGGTVAPPSAPPPTAPPPTAAAATAVAVPPAAAGSLPEPLRPTHELQRLRVRSAQRPPAAPQLSPARRVVVAIATGIAAGVVATWAWSSGGRLLGWDSAGDRPVLVAAAPWLPSGWTLAPAMRPQPPERVASVTPVARTGPVPPLAQRRDISANGGMAWRLVGTAAAETGLSAIPAVTTTTAATAAPAAPPSAMPPPAAPPRSAGRGVTSAPALATTRPAPPRIYSGLDQQVEPPVLRRQHLPNSGLAPGAPVTRGAPALVLLVDETGAVARVQLSARRPPPGETLYRQSMLVAAAKAWRFEPARLNGVPVPYELRLPLEP